jgi:hypothetical protein
MVQFQDGYHWSIQGTTAIMWIIGCITSLVGVCDFAIKHKDNRILIQTCHESLCYN